MFVIPSAGLPSNTDGAWMSIDADQMPKTIWARQCPGAKARRQPCAAQRRLSKPDRESNRCCKADFMVMGTRSKIRSRSAVNIGKVIDYITQADATSSTACRLCVQSSC
jgi:hypothetical protein